MEAEHVARRPVTCAPSTERYLTIRVEPELRSRFLKRCAERDETPGSAIERMMDRYAPDDHPKGKTSDPGERGVCHD